MCRHSGPVGVWSSVGVLFIFQITLRGREVKDGAHSIMMNRGPVVQRIGLQFPKLPMGVRFPPGLPATCPISAAFPTPFQSWQTRRIVRTYRPTGWF